jgi:hypothetical protein
VFPWTIVARALRVALQPRALLLAALALIGTSAGWRVCGWVCGGLFLDAPASTQSADPMTDALPPDGSPAVDLAHDQRLREAINRLRPWPWESASPAAIGGGESLLAALSSAWWADNPVLHVRRMLSAPFVGLFDAHASFDEFVFFLLCACWELAVWAFFGAALTRFAAVALARDEWLSFGQLTEYARGKWSNYFTAPLFPLGVVFFAAIPLALVGLLLRFELGMLLAGILWFVVLLGGLFMAVLLVGLFFGWPLMWATISAEGTDSFDALSRSYAYTYQRPLHYFFYYLAAALLGALGWAVVALFAAASIGLGNWGASWLAGSDISLAAADDRWATLIGGGAFASPHPVDAGSLGSLGKAGQALIAFWVGVALTVATAFAFSYFWAATTAIYFLLRRQVDATEMDECYLPDERQPYGMPPLETDAAGVAGVADAPTE